MSRMHLSLRYVGRFCTLKIHASIISFQTKNHWFCLEKCVALRAMPLSPVVLQRSVSCFWSWRTTVPKVIKHNCALILRQLEGPKKCKPANARFQIKANFLFVLIFVFILFQFLCSVGHCPSHWKNPTCTVNRNNPLFCPGLEQRKEQEILEESQLWHIYHCANRLRESLGEKKCVRLCPRQEDANVRQLLSLMFDKSWLLRLYAEMVPKKQGSFASFATFACRR